MHGSPTRHSCLKRSSPVGGKTSEPILWQACLSTDDDVAVKRTLFTKESLRGHSFICSLPPHRDYCAPSFHALSSQCGRDGKSIPAFHALTLGAPLHVVGWVSDRP